MTDSFGSGRGIILSTAFVGNLSGGYGTGCRIDVASLVVEEDMGAEGFQHRLFVPTAHEERLIDVHVPGAQGTDDAFVGRGVAGGD